MIAPIGYAVLSDFGFQLYREFREWVEEPENQALSQKTAVYFTMIALKNVLESTSELSVYSIDGLHHRVSKNVLQQVSRRTGGETSALNFAIIHVPEMMVDFSKVDHYGVSKSARKKMKWYQRAKKDYVYDRVIRSAVEPYRKLDGYFLTCREAELPDITDRLVLKKLISYKTESDEKVSDQVHTEESLEFIEARLRDQIGSGNLPIRDQFRDQFAPNLKVDSFKEMWRAVALDYPEISKPGPKSKKRES